MHPDNVCKTTITTPFESFEYLRMPYLRMPFGLMNAGSTFQRKANKAMTNLEAIFACLNDMQVASKNQGDHAVHLRQLFLQLREHK